MQNDIKTLSKIRKHNVLQNNPYFYVSSPYSPNETVYFLGFLPPGTGSETLIICLTNYPYCLKQRSTSTRTFEEKNMVMTQFMYIFLWLNCIIGLQIYCMGHGGTACGCSLFSVSTGQELSLIQMLGCGGTTSAC